MTFQNIGSKHSVPSYACEFYIMIRKYVAVVFKILSDFFQVMVF